jgi:hypothetical protein
MRLFKMTLFSFTVIGVVVTLIGLAVAILSFIFIKENKLSSVITGIFFSVIGFLIFWLSLNPDKPIGINLGLSDKSASFLIPILVLGMFMYRAVTILKEGWDELKDENLPVLLIYRGRWKIFGGILMIIFYTFILLELFSWLLKG